MAKGARWNPGTSPRDGKRGSIWRALGWSHTSVTPALPPRPQLGGVSEGASLDRARASSPPRALPACLGQQRFQNEVPSGGEGPPSHRPDPGVDVSNGGRPQPRSAARGTRTAPGSRLLGKQRGGSSIWSKSPGQKLAPGPTPPLETQMVRGWQLIRPPFVKKHVAGGHSHGRAPSAPSASGASQNSRQERLLCTRSCFQKREGVYQLLSNSCGKKTKTKTKRNPKFTRRPR